MTYTGVFAGIGNIGGTIELTSEASATSSTSRFRTLAVYAASGKLTTGGLVVELTGTYDSISRQFTVSGGGFRVSATVAGTTVSGTVETPSGTSGTVTAAVGSPAQTSAQYCGTFGGDDQGRLRFTVSGSNFTGLGGNDGGYLPLHGTVNGSAMQGSGKGDDTTVTLSGTLSGGRWNGQWSNNFNERGTWTAAVCE